MKKKIILQMFVGAVIDLKDSVISLVDGSGTRNVETFTCDVQANFVTGDYISFYVGSAKNYIWFDLDGNDAEPAGLSTVASPQKHICDISTATTAADVAEDLTEIFNTIEGISAVQSTANVAVTQDNFGVVSVGDVTTATGVASVATTTAGTASNKVAVKIGDGNLTFSEKKTMEYLLDRGRLDTVREGDEVPVDVSMQFRWEELTAISGSGAPTVNEILKKEGEAADWVSSDVDDCGAPYCVDVEILHTPRCASIHKELTVLRKFRYEDLSHDASAGTISCTGKCNVTTAESVRIPNT